MGTALDIRAQIEADTNLQTEISKALLAVTEGLGKGSDGRVVRLLTRTLEASWHEHVSFQNMVVFPILEGRHARDVSSAIARSHLDHAALSERHRDVGRRLDLLLETSADDVHGLERLLRVTIAQRRIHFHRDAELERWLPDAFSRLECVLCERWVAARQSPRFPLGLLRSPDRPYPRFGGQLD
jgi:hypothetical protein